MDVFVRWKVKSTAIIERKRNPRFRILQGDVVVAQANSEEEVITEPV